MFVSESKFRSCPADFIPHILDPNPAALLALITKPAVEAALLRRLDKKARWYGAELGPEGDPVPERGAKVMPEEIVRLYEEYIIPLTKDVEVRPPSRALEIKEPLTRCPLAGSRRSSTSCIGSTDSPSPKSETSRRRAPQVPSLRSASHERRRRQRYPAQKPSRDLRPSRGRGRGRGQRGCTNEQQLPLGKHEQDPPCRVCPQKHTVCLKGGNGAGIDLGSREAGSCAGLVFIRSVSVTAPRPTDRPSP